MAALLRYSFMVEAMDLFTYCFCAALGGWNFWSEVDSLKAGTVENSGSGPTNGSACR